MKITKDHGDTGGVRAWREGGRTLPYVTKFALSS